MPAGNAVPLPGDMQRPFTDLEGLAAIGIVWKRFEAQEGFTNQDHVEFHFAASGISVELSVPTYTQQGESLRRDSDSSKVIYVFTMRWRSQNKVSPPGFIEPCIPTVAKTAP